jgi:hypothetical protein
VIAAQPYWADYADVKRILYETAAARVRRAAWRSARLVAIVRKASAGFGNEPSTIYSLGIVIFWVFK